MTAGQGFIALGRADLRALDPDGARWRRPCCSASPDALQLVLSINAPAIPSEFLAMLPYVATIFAVAGLVGRSGPLPPTASRT